MLLVDFINVGYGDAILIRDTDAAFSMLVDCGDAHIGRSRPDGQRITAADYLRREGIRQLDLLVLTHLHLDHAGGLLQLLPEIEIREFWTNYLPPEQVWGTSVPVPDGWSAGARCLLSAMEIYLGALAHLRAQGTRIRVIRETHDFQQLTAALSAEVFLEDRALHRQQAAIWEAVLSGSARGEDLDCLDGFINNTSIRLRLSCAGQEIELPGDVYASCWERHQLSPCAIVKLPHHGHRDSLTPSLLQMLRPAHAVISVSDSRTDNCPCRDIIRLLRENEVAVSYTDAVRQEDGQCSVHLAVQYQIEPGSAVKSREITL